MITRGEVMKDSKKKDIHILQYINIINVIKEDPFISLSDLSSQIKLPKNIISRFLKKMYTEKILTGPQLSVKPHRNYTPYIYLLQVSNPYEIFQELKTLHHVKNYVIAVGEWNMSMLTDQMMDFSELKGFQKVVFAGKRYDVYSPRIQYINWEQSIKEIKEKLESTILTAKKRNIRILPELLWGEKEWELYKALRLNVRQNIRPVLKEHTIPYETYQEWKKTVLDHCTVHIGFYPRGLDSYMDFYIIFRTDFAQVVKEFFSLFPTTPFLADLDDHILVVVRIPFNLIGDVSSIIDGMREKGIVEDAHCAIGLFT